MESDILLDDTRKLSQGQQANLSLKSGGFQMHIVCWKRPSTKNRNLIMTLTLNQDEHQVNVTEWSKWNKRKFKNDIYVSSLCTILYMILQAEYEGMFGDRDKK